MLWIFTYETVPMVPQTKSAKNPNSPEDFGISFLFI
jgi:hypothetical protein